MEFNYAQTFRKLSQRKDVCCLLKVSEKIVAFENTKLILLKRSKVIREIHLQRMDWHYEK